MIRSANKKDIDGILNILGKAFNTTMNKGREIYLRDLVLKELHCWRVMVLNDNIIGAVHISVNELRIGKAIVTKMDPGEVSVLPEYHGKGYGTMLMQDTIEWMKKENCDISRLGGLTEFYSRFGYLRFPRRYIEFTVGKKVQAGASMVKEDELFLEKEIISKIRQFNPKKDSQAYLKISEEFNKKYTTSRVIYSQPKLSEKNPLHLVYEDKGKILGFMFAIERKEDFSEFEAKITINEVGYKKDKQTVIGHFIKYLYNYSLKNKMKRITARVPFDPQIKEQLLKIPVNFKIIEIYGGKSSNMLQIINLKSLFTKLVPELENRLHNSLASNWRGTVEINIGKDNVKFFIGNGKIRLLNEILAELKIVIEEYYLLELVLGLVSFGEIKQLLNEKIELTPVTESLLNDLFPRKLVGSGNWE
ncbi:MAG: hypothetical protein A2474_06195 [Elusimicrobia bacterium RIFOXYC2_FULL_34_12]|nr:MAG: hypothetical protein A2474_06195 [Elusimicrobia bacterium RIFOXYC2_FULL_34_12]OGS38192.1 MAG: hypothetical protein A2551_03120 [Elusimicrobia bacterium RIFOXYD2_FULL_34_30]HAM38480.1 hypothetical protein [Elusimicrobiota bacterium]